MGNKIKEKKEKKENDGIYTTYICNNDLLLEKASRLYFKDGMKIADTTWGKGVFWKLIDRKKYDFYKSDLITCPESPYDFTNLPKDIYSDESFDVVVFDPPYAHNPGRMIVNKNYKNAETTKGFYHKDIIELYRKGMKEGVRILKKGGVLLVKCRDEVESSVQKRSHIELWNIAINELSLTDEDLFVLMQKTFPKIQYLPQKHARKNNSFLWVFRK